jgi:hypothetical protein
MSEERLKYPTRFDYAARVSDFLTMYLDLSPHTADPVQPLLWADEVLGDLVDLEKGLKKRSDRTPVGIPTPIHSALAEWQQKHHEFFELHKELMSNLPAVTEAIKKTHDDLVQLRDLSRMYKRLEKRVRVVTEGFYAEDRDDDVDD